MRPTHDPRSLWVLTGVAARIAQSLGLHRDGASLGLPPFQVEMRRRLWWQIALLEGRAATLSGSGLSILAQLSDTKLPLNVNDSDLNAGMRVPPTEHPGTTEMLFCLIRCEVADFLSSAKSSNGFDGSWQKLSGSATSLASKDKAIDEWESSLERKYLRYCDTEIPLHFLVVAMARSAVCRMRLVAHHPRRYPDNGARMAQEEKDLVFSTSLDMIELDNMGQKRENIRRFLWHINAHLQLDPLVYILDELRSRKTGDLVDRAWRHVDEVFENHSELLTDTSNALYRAIRNLAVTAWEAREQDMTRLYQGKPAYIRPRFLSTLGLTSPSGPPASNNVSWQSSGDIPRLVEDQLKNDQSVSGLTSGVDSLPPPGNLTLEPNQMDWAYWDELLQGCELSFDTSQN